MTCINPRLAYKQTNGQYTLKAISEHAPIDGSFLVPCGSCMPCLIAKTRDTATRMVDESYLHDESCFLTLTYNDENIPKGHTLVLRHMQLFVKRLRKLLHPQKIRIVYVGEYGEETNRPHYHACLFGHRFEDQKHFKKTPQGHILYTSETLAKLWPHGHCSIGDFNVTTAEYCAKYIIKAQASKGTKTTFLDDETGEIIELAQPFIKASRNPGIGAGFYEKYKDQIYNEGASIINGKARPIPKYYDRKLRAEDPQRYEQIKQARFKKAMDRAESNPHLQTVQGHHAIHTILQQKIKHKKRDF